MERLHPLMRVIPIFLFLAGLQAATGADYCSLVVRVLSPDQRRPLEVPISVREKSSRVLEKETTTEDVKFCDLGISPVTVTVGNDTCNQVVVRDVPLEWNEQYLLTVTYDPEPCMPERPPAPVPVCQVLFRVSDAKGNWIEKASIHFQGSSSPPLETDSAGRALRLVKVGDRVTGAVDSRGYTSKTFSVSCPQSERVHEESIKLEHQ